MDYIYLSHYTFSRFTPTILSILIFLFLLFRTKSTTTSKQLTAYFFFVVLFNLGNLLAYAIYYPIYFSWYLAALAPFGLVIQIQFAYSFPKFMFKKEARYALWISFILGFISFIEYVVQTFFHDITLNDTNYGNGYISTLIPLFVLFSYIWIFIIFIRKSLLFKKKNDQFFVNATRSFAGVVFIEILNVIVLTLFITFNILTNVTVNFIMNLGFLLVYYLYVIVYITFSERSTTFLVKVSSLSIMTFLFIFGIVGHYFFLYNKQLYNKEKITDIKYISELVKTEQFSKIPEDVYYIVNETGDIIYSKDQNFAPCKTCQIWSDTKRKIPFSQLMSLTENKQIFLQMNKRNYFQYNVSLDDKTVGIGFDHLFFKEQEHQMAKRVLLIFMLSILSIILIFPLIFNASIIRPLKNLLNGVKKVDKGNFNIHLPVIYKDEIGYVTEGFNQMVVSLREQHEKLEDYSENLAKKVEEKTSELLKAKKYEEKARRKAEDANMMKSEFLANVSHEIRTPMNAIIGFTRLMLEEEEDEDKREQLSIINVAGENLLNLINDILDFSKIEADRIELSIEHFNVRDLFNDLEKMFKLRIAEKDIYLNFLIDENMPEKLTGDRFRISQVLTNIIGNAVKFTHEGGVIIKAFHHRKKLNIEVKDTGIGIALDKLQQIFEPFRQEDGSTTRDFGGSGLGLAISRKIIMLMRGSIFVESEKNKGSSFHITIPANSSDAQHNNTQPVTKTTHEKTHLLIIEQNPITTKLLSAWLKKHDFDFSAVNSATRGIDHIKSHHTDVVLLDMSIIDIQPAKTLHTILENCENQCRTIAMTSEPVAKERDKLLSSGFAEVIQKPVDLSKLGKILNNR